MKFYEEKGMAYCGLACVLCSEEACPGCKAKGQKEGCECTVYQCAVSKGLDGCYECKEFPCSEEMHQNVRNRAFNRFAREFGKDELLNCLHRNFEEGICYHRSGGIAGDYDSRMKEEEVLDFIRYGKENPYFICPDFQTENFLLRLVTEEDAVDLLSCYSDKKAQVLFNSDCCTSDFCYTTRNEMQGCIRMWLDSYIRGDFVRFAIVDVHTEKAVGTIEMFGYVGTYKVTRGILRLDLASAYEKESVLKELISLCGKEFFRIFGVNEMVTKAAPWAAERISAVKALGFTPYDFTGREYYWGLNK